MSVIPVLIVYAFANRTFIRGLALTGFKVLTPTKERL